MGSDPPFRVLVTGSRTWGDYATVREEIGVVVAERMVATGVPYPGIVVVHGAARGADQFAARAASELRLQAEAHPADWDRHGRGAGLRRNAEMVALGAGVCLAFIRAGSRGATHCAGLAEKAGIPVRRFETD
jgi:hypothetical protein